MNIAPLWSDQDPSDAHAIAKRLSELRYENNHLFCEQYLKEKSENIAK